VLPDLVERAAGGPQLDALGHDGAFALIGDLDVDVLTLHRIVSLVPAPAVLRPSAVLLTPLLAGQESRLRSLPDQLLS
jgi:hypothetical protein